MIFSTKRNRADIEVLSSMPEIIGIDLGVRSAHISTSRGCYTFGSKLRELSRDKELQHIYDSMSERFTGCGYYAFVEEPVVAGARNLRTSLRIAQISGAVLAAVPGELVPVPRWKKEVVGKGNATKEEVREWLESQPGYENPLSSQDHVDATCLRFYGQMRGI